MAIDLEQATDNLEVQLGYLCNYLERTNKALNNETENLLSLSHGGIIFGTTEENDRKIERVCFSCKTLLETQLQLLGVVEGTLRTLNLSLQRGNSKK